MRSYAISVANPVLLMSLKRSRATERGAEVDGGETQGHSHSQGAARLPGATGAGREGRVCQAQGERGRAGTLVSDSWPPIWERESRCYF